MQTIIRKRQETGKGKDEQYYFSSSHFQPLHALLMQKIHHIGREKRLCIRFFYFSKTLYFATKSFKLQKISIQLNSSKGDSIVKKCISCVLLAPLVKAKSVRNSFSHFGYNFVPGSRFLFRLYNIYF